MATVTGFLIVVGVTAACWFGVKAINNNFKNYRLKILEQAKDFAPDRFIVDEYGTQLICLNYEKSSIRIVKLDNKTKEFKSEEFKVRDLISFEIEERGRVISRVSNKSMIGRAAVGGMLFGGVGAIIGGATAKQKSVEGGSGVTTIKLIVDDLDNPVRRFEVRPIAYNHEKKLVIPKFIFEEIERWGIIINKILLKEGAEVETGIEIE